MPRFKFISFLLIIYGLFAWINCLNHTNNYLIYQSPVEWAWNEYRAWTFFSIALISISGILNIYFVLNYCGFLNFNETRNSIRLRPTNDFID